MGNAQKKPEPFDWSTFDVEEFKTWYIDHSYNPEHLPLWLRAIEHRKAWELGYVDDDASPKDMVESYHDIVGGNCAWISKKGEVHPLTYENHDNYSAVILGGLSGDMECTHARVTTHLSRLDEAWCQVPRPTKKMKEAAMTFVMDNAHYYQVMISKGF